MCKAYSVRTYYKLCAKYCFEVSNYKIFHRDGNLKYCMEDKFYKIYLGA